MSNLPKVTVYQDNMSTATANQVGYGELTNRNALNAVVDILDGVWADWRPTLVWTGTTVPVLTTVAKYTQVGSWVNFVYGATSAANTGVSVTGLTITLPVTPKDINSYIPLDCHQLQTGGAYRDAQAYIDVTTDSASERLVRFRNIHPIYTNAYAMYLAGAYEVA